MRVYFNFVRMHRKENKHALIAGKLSAGKVDCVKKKEKNFADDIGRMIEF